MAATDPIIDLAFRRHAQELRDSWQARLLGRSITVWSGAAKARDKMGMCVMSILHHNFDDAMPVLLALFGARGWVVPYLISAAKIAKNGAVMANYINKNRIEFKNQELFTSTQDMETQFRRLADSVRLTDAERKEFFAAAIRWVVCDYRLDPTMNAADPDAKRLTVH